jgi:hypothetical protein
MSLTENQQRYATDRLRTIRHDYAVAVRDDVFGDTIDITDLTEEQQALANALRQVTGLREEVLNAFDTDTDEAKEILKDLDGLYQTAKAAGDAFREAAAVIGEKFVIPEDQQAQKLSQADRRIKAFDNKIQKVRDELEMSNSEAVLGKLDELEAEVKELQGEVPEPEA